MDLVDRAVYIDHGVIQRVYTGDEFRTLDDSERVQLGLRCFTLDNRKEKIPTQSRDGVLKISNLSISYGQDFIIKDASFTADRGDIIAVTGHNGSGKSAFLRVLCGLVKEKSGKLYLRIKRIPSRGAEHYVI